jgi:class 3 adenylate cyclase/tetratricopeptide (TPR) repeat protein
VGYKNLKNERKMKCSKCQTENPEKRKFCRECGAKLQNACPQCGNENLPGDKFCGECGNSLTELKEGPAIDYTKPQSYTPKFLVDKILTTRSSIQGERKLVTVLFADVANYTSISEKLDPEEVHQIMDGCFNILMDEIHKYEGTINQFTGDGVMALFGAPVAHEDHAQRGCRAALDIQSAMLAYGNEITNAYEREFKIRIGLNSGPVVVGTIGDDLRMDYTAVGDTTNLAARLQQVADPERIVISESTHRLVSGYCITRSLGELLLKGVSQPVPAWELVAANETRTRLEVEAERGLTPFVGRARELQTLHECFVRAQAGQGKVVFLVGEAGIGKSRLLLEFRRQLVEEDSTWLEGHAMSFGRSMAFHPLIDLLKRNFRIDEDDSERKKIEKIQHGVQLVDRKLYPILPYIRYLLAVDPGETAVQAMDPQMRRGEIFNALQRLLISAATVRPQILVFEDLHWMDQATEESLKYLADSIPNTRVLLICTYRPGYAHPFGDRTYHTRIVLPTITATDSVQMAQAMLATEHLPEALQALIIKKAEGNPFFVEEVVKSLREAGAIRHAGDDYVLTKPLEEIVVPDTIQDVLMARIDRLEDVSKKTLQLASVIGREFTYRLLERIADIRERTEEYLQELKAIELIYEKHLFPELVYMFKHALTQDVAYNSLLIQRRQELHRFIGQAIEELYVDRLAEQYEILAYHYMQGEAWDKALKYLYQAADKAAQTFANREAIALYDQALEAASHLGDAADAQTRMAIHKAKVNLFFVLSDFENSRAEGECLLNLAHEVGDRANESLALASIGRALHYAHDLEQALAYSERALEVAEAADARHALAGAYFTNGVVQAVTGHLDLAQKRIDQAITISQSEGDVVDHALSLYLSGILKNWEGDYTEALRPLSHGLHIASEHKLPVPLIRCLWTKGLVLIGRGEYDEAQSALEEGLALSGKVGEEAWAHRLLNSLGWLYFECGDLGRAMDFNQQGADGARRHGDAEIIANSELNLADTFLAKDDLASAQKLLEGVQHLVNDPATSDHMKWRYSTHLFVSFGELCLAVGDIVRARKFVDRCLEIATQSNSRKYLVKGWRLKGEIARLEKQQDEAEGWLQQALSLAQTIGNPTQLWLTHAALARLYERMKRKDRELENWKAAETVIISTADRLKDEKLRKTFIRSATVQEIMETTKRF